MDCDINESKCRCLGFSGFPASSSFPDLKVGCVIPECSSQEMITKFETKCQNDGVDE